MKFGRSRTLQSTKYLKKKRKKLFVLLSIISSSILVFLILLILIIRIPFFQIKSIEISGASSIDPALIEKSVRDEIVGNYFYFIPKTSFIFYPKGKIEENLLNNYKKIDNLEIDGKGLSRLNISFSERVPEVIMCEGFKEDLDHENCFYADKTGFAFEKTASTSIEYFKYYIDSSLNKEIENFSELQAFVENVNNNGIKTTGMLISPDGSYELYIKNNDESNAVVYFDDRIPLEKTLSNLLVFWQNVMDKKIGLSTIPNFDYINLRFGNNIFYLAK